MAAATSRRGPDGRGLRTLGPLTLGHCRLAIIDLTATGAQPITVPDGGLLAAVNGEIHNHEQIAGAAPPGAVAPGRSDARAVPAAYRLHGLGFPAALDGMFAFALYDAELDRLMLARDAFGEKPLFYRTDAESLWFASTLDALIEPDDVVDRRSLHAAFLHGGLRAPRTVVQGVEALEPGTMLVVESRVRRIERWFSPRDPFPDPARSYLRDLIDRAVAKRLEADVPVGVFLSGGLDSAAILEAATRLGGSGRPAFTAAFAARAFDESPAAAVVARQFGARHEIVTIAEPTLADLDALVGSLGEPLFDASAYALMKLVEFARPTIKVALGGDGGDELFLGYDRYRAVAAASRPAVGLLLRLLGPFFSGRRRAKMRALWGDGEATPARRLLLLQAHGASPFLDDIFGRTATLELRRDEGSDYDAIEAAYKGYSLPQRLMMIDRETILAADYLVKSDRIATARGMEIRSPFLDRALFEAVAGRMRRDPFAPGMGKTALRRLLKGKLPETILSAPKRGFGTPLGIWMNGALGKAVRELLLEPKARLSDLFPRTIIERLFAAAAANEGMAAEMLYAAAIAELWLRRLRLTIR